MKERDRLSGCCDVLLWTGYCGVVTAGADTVRVREATVEATEQREAV
jgi:hypothetical protein